MQIGDRIQVVGTIRDIVKESVLVVMDADGWEYWFKQQHVAVTTPAAPAATTPAPAAAATSAEAPAESQPDLEAMTKDELVAYGHKQGLKLDPRQTKDDLIAQIEDHVASKR